MLTRAGHAVLTFGIFLVLASLPNGNLFLASLAIFPFLLVSRSLLFGTPVVKVSAQVEAGAKRVGQKVEVTVRYDVRGGQGILELQQGLPGEFELVEGNNLHLMRKGLRSLRGEFRFAIRCKRRGHFDMPPMRWELVPTLGLSAAKQGGAAQGTAIEFRPVLSNFKRIPGGKDLAKTMMPNEDRAVTGIRTTEFEEIRAYARGDPPRSINWKATARVAAGRAPDQPMDLMVNQYEAEGRKSVWVFLDAGPHMRMGSNFENAFEAAVHAAGSTAQYFLDKGYTLGFTIYNLPEPVILYPDSGRRQRMRIEEELHKVEPTQVGGTFLRTALDTRRFLRGGGFVIVVVTRADRADDDLVEGLRKLRASRGRRRGRAPIMLLSPDAYGLVPEPEEHQASRAIQDVLDEDNVRRVRRQGVQMLRWDPAKRPIDGILARGRF